MDEVQLRQSLHSRIDLADNRLLKMIDALIETYSMKDESTVPDWWEELTDEERLEIEEGLAQADRGDFIPHEQVMKKFDKWR